MQSLRCPFLTFAALLVALASTYVLRYGSLAARAAVLPEERQAWAKGAELRANAKGAKPGRGCCAESLELQLPELPRGHLKVKWRKASVKPGDVMEILVVNDTKSGSKAKGSNGSMASCDRDPFTCKGVEVTNVFVWLVSSDTHQLSADVATPVGPGRWSARVGPLEPGKWMAHALAIITFQDERKPFLFTEAQGSPWQLQVTPAAPQPLPRRRCKLGVDALEGRWVRTSSGLCSWGCPRDGWTLVSKTCHWHVHTPAEVHEKVTKPLWLAILGNSIMRGALQALVDQLVPEAWQSFVGIEDAPGKGTNVKCWGWLDFEVGNLRLSFQDYRIWFYTEERNVVAFERLKRLIWEGPDLLVIQHDGPDVTNGQPPFVYQPVLTSTLPAYFKKKKKGKIIFALSKLSPFIFRLCNPQCSDRQRPQIWNRSVEELLAKLPQDLRSSALGRVLAVDEAFVCMPLFLDGETDLAQRKGSKHWHRYANTTGPGRKVFGAAADAAGHWYLAELLTMAGAHGAGSAAGVGNLSAKACAQCPPQLCCPFQPVPVKLDHSLSVVRDMPQIKSWADLTMQSCGQLI